MTNLNLSTTCLYATCVFLLRNMSKRTVVTRKFLINYRGRSKVRNGSVWVGGYALLLRLTVAKNIRGG